MFPSELPGSDAFIFILGVFLYLCFLLKSLNYFKEHKFMHNRQIDHKMLASTGFIDVEFSDFRLFQC